MTIGQNVDRVIDWWQSQSWHRLAEIGISAFLGGAAGAGLTRHFGFKAAGMVTQNQTGVGAHAETVGAAAGAITGAATTATVRAVSDAVISNILNNQEEEREEEND